MAKKKIGKTVNKVDSSTNLKIDIGLGDFVGVATQTSTLLEGVVKKIQDEFNTSTITYEQKNDILLSSISIMRGVRSMFNDAFSNVEKELGDQLEISAINSHEVYEHQFNGVSNVECEIAESTEVVLCKPLDNPAAYDKMQAAGFNADKYFAKQPVTKFVINKDALINEDPAVLTRLASENILTIVKRSVLKF